jgi:hypothetical protein
LESSVEDVKIIYHESILTLVKTEPTLASNKSFSSFYSKKLSERLNASAWTTAKTEIVKGYFVTNTSEFIMRIQTDDGTLSIRSSDSAWVWSDKISRVWLIFEKNFDWPKW